MKPRVLFAGRRRFSLPLDDGLQRRYDALGAELDWRQLGSGRGGDERFRLLSSPPALDGPLFYLRFPFALARELRAFRPDVTIVQGAEETALALAARRLARSPTRVVFDVQGDWRASTRLYGSALRRPLAPITDALARIALRSDAVRTISPFTTGLVRGHGVEPAAQFPTYMDLAPFTKDPVGPLPDEPEAIFVGALERVKGLDTLLAAWELVRAQVPGARLSIVGGGALAGQVAGSGVQHDALLTAPELAARLDRAWVLVLPSRTEGFGRVIVEAYCRGRAVVGTRVGAIPDLVEHGETGVLVDPGDAEALADALSRVLSDRELAQRLGATARERSERWVTTPEEFAARIRDLVDRVTKL